MTSDSSSRRIHAIFTACLALLGICSGMGGAFLFLRWQAERVDSAAPTLLNQSAQIFSKSLENQKQALEILRDTLERTPKLSPQERQELLRSTSDRIPHLAFNGWTDRQGKFTGWASPNSLSVSETGRVITAALRQTKWDRFWGRASTLVTTGKRNQMLLVFVQPLRMPPSGRNLISAVDPAGLLAGLVPPGSQRQLPLQVLLGNRVLYQSSDWADTSDKPGRVRLQRTISFDGIRWVMESRPKEIPRSPSRWPSWILFSAGLLGVLAVGGMFWATTRLRHMATTDELTGLYNRRFFLERWQEEVARAKRYKRELSCLIIDVNGFKRINDQIGHLAGDQALQQVSVELKRQLRRTDVLARFGGDEFIVALPETTLGQALAVAEKLRSLDLRGTESWRHRIGPVTLSVGSAHLQENDLPLDVIARADQDLYASRQAPPQPATTIPQMTNL